VPSEYISLGIVKTRLIYHSRGRAAGRQIQRERLTSSATPVLVPPSPQLLIRMTSLPKRIIPRRTVVYSLSTLERSLSAEKSSSGDGWRSRRGGLDEILGGEVGVMTT
jgi:hypothetical protein